MLLHKLLVAAGIAGFAASGPAEVGVVYKFDFTRKLVSGGLVTRKFTLDINTMGVSDGVFSTPIGPYLAPDTTFGILRLVPQICIPQRDRGPRYVRQQR